MEQGDPSTQARRDRILAALLSDRGISHLVDEAADALGNPIVVVDPSYHYVASGGVSPAADDDSAYARVMREEMAFVGMYVDLLQVRFPEVFRVETDISDEAMNRHVLPCSVQLLIENAIKHNSVGADRPLVIRIVAVAEAVTVSNNLQLKVSGNPSTRVGLNYIRQQYLDLSGIPIGIRRTDTEYCVTLPLL